MQDDPGRLGELHTLSSAKLPRSRYILPRSRTEKLFMALGGKVMRKGLQSEVS
jgi:hypothetical protein